MSRMKKTYPVLALIGLALAAGGGYWWWSQRSAADAVQYRTAKLERGNLQATVSASGAVNPVTQVSVGTQVSGQIKELYVDFNSEVKAGQLIARIDPETFEYRVRSAQADVDAANAAVVTAQAAAAASRANVSRAQVDLQEAQRDQERKQTLVEKQFIAQSEGDKARALVNTAGELVKQAQAQAGVTEEAGEWVTVAGTFSTRVRPLEVKTTMSPSPLYDSDCGGLCGWLTGPVRNIRPRGPSLSNRTFRGQPK